MERKLVAVVVPVSSRPHFEPDELISLRQLSHYLGKYDRYLAAPEGSPISFADFLVEYFPLHFFGSIVAHTRMMLSEQFYRRFAAYEYILNYHPDALVFSDDLESWCRQGWDYIGPPWVRSQNRGIKVERVGNGGFSLRRIDSFLKVLTSKRYWQSPEEYWTETSRRYSGIRRWVRLPKKYWKGIRMFNNVRRHIRYDLKTGRFEDWFWAVDAQRYMPGFRIAPVDLALQFGFEVDPRDCYERTNRRLPFGCHAWARYDRAFWEPHLLPPGRTPA